MDIIDLDITPGNVASRLVPFDQVVLENNKNQANDAFVTELTAYHLTGRYQKPYILDILYQIEITNSVSEFEQLTDKMTELLRKMQNELRDKRERLFVVHNKGTADVYGVLADNIKKHDRDLYIKELVNYYEIIKSLKDISKEKNVECCSLQDDSEQSFNDMQNAVIIFLNDALSSDSVRICHSSSLYGDLCAIHNLMRDISSEVPDFTFDCGYIYID